MNLPHMETSTMSSIYGNGKIYSFLCVSNVVIKVDSPTMINLGVWSYATPIMYAFQASCCSKCFISSYFMSRPAPNPTVLLVSPVSGICRSQKWTDRNPASSKQSLISGNDHLITRPIAA
ncbi:hypothetical protein TorRG33x02_032170 [Trema orientale]|uniref:Uncharacterized protein n=1 Tax=Trema orientale TaxID=63057 RepID=A0A2P5FTC7_TREOI|nr:hypothetical protein TorRG33x02_032170 [Trema orientale]